MYNIKVINFYVIQYFQIKNQLYFIKKVSYLAIKKQNINLDTYSDD